MVTSLMMSTVLTLGIMTALAGRFWLRASVEREHRAFQRELDAIMLGRLELVEAARQSEKKKDKGETHAHG